MQIRFSAQTMTPAIRFGENAQKPKSVDIFADPEEQAVNEPPKDTLEKSGQPAQPAKPAGPADDVSPAESTRIEIERTYVNIEGILDQVDGDLSGVQNLDFRKKRVNDALQRFQDMVETNPRYSREKRFLEQNPGKLFDLFLQMDPTNAQEMVKIRTEMAKGQAELSNEQAKAEMREAMNQAAHEAKEAAIRAAQAAAEAAGKAARAAGEAAKKAPGAIKEGVGKTAEFAREVREAARGDEADPCKGPAGEGEDVKADAVNGDDLSLPEDPPEESLSDKASDAVDQAAGKLKGILGRFGKKKK